MTLEILLYSGSLILVSLGAVHVMAFYSVFSGFGDIFPYNRRIFTMAWMAGAMTLIFIRALTALVAFSRERANTTASLVYSASGGMLIAHSGLPNITGVRTPALPVKLFPLITGICAALFLPGPLL